MHWFFRDISDDPSEKELTQQDQFNNDEVALAEALVRETIQNSTDAQASPEIPVRVRFVIKNSAPDRQFFSSVLSGLEPHLRACRLPVPSQSDAAKILIVEDFGTTGLAGSVDEKDDGQFSGFWRRFGRSNKKQGKEGGRWGLGKLVFPSASAIRTVIGLTRRSGEGRSWLMGQAILRNHSINGREQDSVGFWCRANALRKGLPTDDPKICESLAKAAGLTRKSEPGLSLVVPYLLPDINQDLLIEAAILNYYFPILTGRLTVDINGKIIDAATFDRVAASLKNALPQSLLDFVRLLQSSRHDTPFIELPPKWQNGRISRELLADEVITALRDRYRDGKLILVRAPLSVRSKDSVTIQTYIDLFIKNAQPGEKSQTLVVRGAITVPTEGKRLNFPECHAALVAADDPISRLLGDAENPAHTQWSERAGKLRDGWQSGGMVVRRVRALLPEIYGLISERIEREDSLALLEFFSIPKTDRTGGPPNISVGRPDNLPTPEPKVFRIEKRSGGFSILPGPGIERVDLPIKLEVRCAYDVLTGNPFRRYSDFDFSFFRAPIRIDKKNALCWPTKPNEIQVEANRKEFKVEVVGFDPNRDLIIEAQG